MTDALVDTRQKSARIGRLSAYLCTFARVLASLTLLRQTPNWKLIFLLEMIMRLWVIIQRKSWLGEGRIGIADAGLRLSCEGNRNCSTWNNLGRMGTALARFVASSCVLYGMPLRKIMPVCALLQRTGIFEGERKICCGLRLLRLTRFYLRLDGLASVCAAPLLVSYIGCIRE
jgi:hypothetical protein